MASINLTQTVYNITSLKDATVTIYFELSDDIDELLDVKLSFNNGENFRNNVSFTNNSAIFNIRSVRNGNYTCVLKIRFMIYLLLENGETLYTEDSQSIELDLPKV